MLAVKETEAVTEVLHQLLRRQRSRQWSGRGACKQIRGLGVKQSHAKHRLLSRLHFFQTSGERTGDIRYRAPVLAPTPMRPASRWFVAWRTLCVRSAKGADINAFNGLICCTLESPSGVARCVGSEAAQIGCTNSNDAFEHRRTKH